MGGGGGRGGLGEGKGVQMESNESVPQFCFPDAANFKSSSSNMKR